MEWAQWPRLQQLLSLATGPAPALPSFSKSRQPRREARAPLRHASHCLTSHQTTLGCAVLRSAPSSGLIPLLGRKKEPRDRKGTEVGVWASSRPRSSLGEGIPVGGAAEIGRSGWCYAAPEIFRLLRSPPLQSSPCRRPATTALRLPARSSLVSPAATLSAETGPRAQSPPPPHTRARARSRGLTHAHECGSAQWEPAHLWCNLGGGMFLALLTDRAFVWEGGLEA